MDDDDLEAMMEQSRQRVREMLDRISKQPSTEVIGVVESITGFSGPHAPPSLSISLKHWREVGGPLERGALFIRKNDIDEGELRAMRRALPDCSVARLHVKLDTAWNEPPEYDRCLLNAIFGEISQQEAQDSELETLAQQLRQQEARAPLGRPAFDAAWLLFDFLARFVEAPRLPVVHIGRPLPGGTWDPAPSDAKDEDQDDGRETFEQRTEQGSITATVLSGVVEGVSYDLNVYRENGVRRMKKLQTLIAAHGRESGKLHRTHDNRHGAMLYMDRARTYEAVYAYNADRLFVRSRRLSA